MAKANSINRDLTGQCFNRFLVIKRVSRHYWLCLCDCGETRKVYHYGLLNGHSASCGCLSIDRLLERSVTHGMTNTSEYRIWSSMHSRCYNRNLKAYPDYGGRGIYVCERWHSFENFFADMGKRPSMNHTLDRYPNNDGPYSPNNCRWAILQEQANNKRNNRIFTYKGKTQTLVQWAREMCLPYKSIHGRIQRGWTIERALTTPMRNMGR